MNKLLFFLICITFPFKGFSKFYEGTMTFSDGKTLSGLIEAPGINDKKISFKSAEKEKKQEYSTNDLDKLVLTINKNNTATFISTKIYEIKGFKMATEPSKDKIWLQSIYEGKLKIYCASMTIYHYNSIQSDVVYYMKTPKKDCPQFVFKDFGQATVAGEFRYIKKAVEHYLKDDCPNIGDLMIKEEIKSQGYQKIGEIYDKNCGK
jgi:hypothetical protein